MELLITNAEYNFIQKKIKNLSQAYTQSNDMDVRIAVKETAFFDICSRIAGFDKLYKYFSMCKMDSLKAIDKLLEIVQSHLNVVNLPILEQVSLKKY